MSGSMIGTPPKVRATTPDPSVKIEVMRDFIPLTPVESTKWHTENGFREVTTTDAFGFQDVEPGWYVGPVRAARPTSAGGADPRQPVRKVQGVYLDKAGKIVRTCDMGDEALPRVQVVAEVVTPKKLRRQAAGATVDTSGREKAPRREPKITNVMIENYLAARGFKGTITPKFRILVRDAMADEIATAAYTQGR